VAESEHDQAVDVETEELEGAEEAAENEAPKKMDLSVTIEDVGPCKKHVRVCVPRDSIEETFEELIDEYTEKAEVPGFRKGFVPPVLVQKRFKKELHEQAKQRVLVASLEQLSEESDLDPINEPNLDLDSIEIPDEGDFEYEFDVEVRPEFDLPTYKGLNIQHPVREITDEDVEAYLQQFLEQYGKLMPIDAPAEQGDFVTVDIRISHDGKPIVHLDDVSLRLRPKLRFQDTELDGFDTFMQGARADEVRETNLTVSMEADSVAMRGETVHAKFTVLDVKRMELPALDDDFLSRIGAESEEGLRGQIREMLERQTVYEQRQSCRRQVLEQITESATWELPEDLVSRQVDNALRRETLEMQQAGFTTREILARENELRQRSLSMTRQNLKEHFVLDRIAEEEGIEILPEDLEMEITMMALQRGENPRRVRAKLQKSGMIENLEAQVRERKAVDVILEHAQFTDVPMPPPTQTDVEALNRSVCRTTTSADIASGTTDESADEEE
jgi:trigger factor